MVIADRVVGHGVRTKSRKGAGGAVPSLAMRTDELEKILPPPGEMEKVTIPRLDIRAFKLHLTSNSPLICNQFSNKARQMMVEKQTKTARMAHEAKKPQELFENSLYKLRDGRYGFPARCFKKAAVSVWNQVGGVKKGLAMGAFHVVGDYDGEYVLLESPEEPTMREDPVRNSNGGADIRYRGMFRQWSVTLTIRYNPVVMSASEITNLFNVAGFGAGVGDWRVNRGGDFGQFGVETATPS